MRPTGRIVHVFNLGADEVTEVLAALGDERRCDSEGCNAPHTVAICYRAPGAEKLTGMVTCDDHHGAGMAVVESIFAAAGMLGQGVAS